MKFGNEFWLILFREYISPKLFAVHVKAEGPHQQATLLILLSDKLGYNKGSMILTKSSPLLLLSGT
jgi:hypothetical protein